MPSQEIKPDSGRKLFFGLFVFPLLIAVGMALLLCSVVLLTNERETPETLIAAIKKAPSGKRWQKAFELSNELNKDRGGLRDESLEREIIRILEDPSRYDEKTRAYMAIALGRFRGPQTASALRAALKDESADVRLYSLWSLGTAGVKEAAPDIEALLDSDDDGLQKMAVYVLGLLGSEQTTPKLRELLKHATPDLRWNAALSLARLGDPSGQDVLLSMLERPRLETDLGLREEDIERVMTNAVKGLALIQNPASIKILENVSRNDKNLRVRQVAIDALKEFSARAT